MKRKIKVYLTTDELLELDGLCSSGVQKIINKYKKMSEAAAELMNHIKEDEIREQAITHCVLCRESVKNYKRKGNVVFRLSGYYLGMKDDKPILVCSKCVNDFFSDIVDVDNNNK